MVFILLACVSALIGVVNTDPVMAGRMGLDAGSMFDVNTLNSSFSEYKIENQETVATDPLSELIVLLSAFINFFFVIWSLLPAVGLGWINLITAILTSINLQNFAVVFAAPLIALQLIAIFYFVRDVWNSVRGAGR